MFSYRRVNVGGRCHRFGLYQETESGYYYGNYEVADQLENGLLILPRTGSITFQSQAQTIIHLLRSIHFIFGFISTRLQMEFLHQYSNLWFFVFVLKGYHVRHRRKLGLNGRSGFCCYCRRLFWDITVHWKVISYLYCVWRARGAEHRQRRWGFPSKDPRQNRIVWIPLILRPAKWKRRADHRLGRLATGQRETGRLASQLASTKQPSVAPLASLIRTSSILLSVVPATTEVRRTFVQHPVQKK